eukprot:scaffold869_cov160-Ochromonas_danica.AAC.17
MNETNNENETSKTRRKNKEIMYRRYLSRKAMLVSLVIYCEVLIWHQTALCGSDRQIAFPSHCQGGQSG